MKKETQDILIAFSLHEGLYYPEVKKIFKTQSKRDRNIQLQEMQKVIAKPMTGNGIKIVQNDEIPQFEAKNEKNVSLQSATNGENKKDE